MLLAGSAMGVVRAMTGFTLFLIAFWLRTATPAAWWFRLHVHRQRCGGS